MTWATSKQQPSYGQILASLKLEIFKKLCYGLQDHFVLSLWLERGYASKSSYICTYIHKGRDEVQSKTNDRQERPMDDGRPPARRISFDDKNNALFSTKELA